MIVRKGAYARQRALPRQMLTEPNRQQAEDGDNHEGIKGAGRHSPGHADQGR